MKRKHFAVNLLVFMIPCLVLIVCFIFFSYSKASADSIGLSEVTKVESVLVKKGDTLSSIASQYANEYSHVPASEYLEQIRRLNNLSSEYITAGNYLLLPNYKD